VRREAKEAQWREQHAMHHATYRLVQETSTLENLKAQYSQTLDHDLCSQALATRIEQRVQALEQLERKKHALEVQDYVLSQQARDVAEQLSKMAGEHVERVKIADHATHQSISHPASHRGNTENVI
jgi:hypothetical protein